MSDEEDAQQSLKRETHSLDEVKDKSLGTQTKYQIYSFYDRLNGCLMINMFYVKLNDKKLGSFTKRNFLLI